MSDKIEGHELMICRNGKPLFAVRVMNQKGNNANYVFVENGDVKFASSWLDSVQGFEVSNDSHRLAKEIFTIGLQSSVKVKILELKQLESIFTDIGIADCLGDSIIDNAKRLEERVHDVVTQEIEANVRPIALRKKESAQKPKGEPDHD